jgi:monoamine oxidase
MSATADVAIIGAGAAGLGAGRRLARAGVRAIVLDAASRVGGRAHTVTPQGLCLDLGCSWLHSADKNPLARLAPALGFEVDTSPAAWRRPALDVNFPLEHQREYRKAFQRLEDRIEAAAGELRDRPAGDLIPSRDQKWRPLLDAFSGYYNGTALGEVSVKDYAAYQPTATNWRLPQGYGTLVASLAQGLDVRLSTPVRRIRHDREPVEIVTDSGVLEARVALIAVPTSIIASGEIGFEPALPDKIDAAAALPLGHVEKAFLKLDDPSALPVERRVYGRTDTAETGSYTLRPLATPVVEGFFGGDLASALAQAGRGAKVAFAIDELTAVLGSDMRRRLSPLAESGWADDPHIRGAYSHARVGESGARAVLARPMSGHLFFAGEACSPHAFSTAHGAYESGVAAAEAALAALG